MDPSSNGRYIYIYISLFLLEKYRILGIVLKYIFFGIIAKQFASNITEPILLIIGLAISSFAGRFSFTRSSTLNMFCFFLNSILTTLSLLTCPFGICTVGCWLVLW